jgi:hypothetical protein
MGIYADSELLKWFTDEFPKHSNQKTGYGESCIRFKKLDQIPFDLIAELVQNNLEEWINTYETNQEVKIINNFNLLL